jgi:hypothetical protein
MEARSNQTNAWTQVLAVDMDRVTTQHDGRASTRLSGIYVKNRLAGFHPYPVIICGISAGDTRLIVSQYRITPEKKIRSLIHHEKRALGKGRKNQSTIATSTYKTTSPLARAENPKVQRPSEVSWSYLYLATSSSAIIRVEFILPKKNQARVGHELKKKKKSEPLNPFWGGACRAHHSLRYLCWWSYVWDVICWFGIGMVQSACHALVGIYRHLHILRRPRRNQLFDVHSLSSWGRRF